MEKTEIRVGRNSKPGKIAEVIKAKYKKNEDVFVRAIGRDAGWNSIKAVALCGLPCEVKFEETIVEEKPRAVLVIKIQ